MSYDVLIVVAPNKLFNEQQQGRWLDTPWRSCEVTVKHLKFNWMTPDKQTFKHQTWFLITR